MKKNIECVMHTVDYIHDELKDGLVYVIDGSLARNKKEYLSLSSHVFNFPIKDETLWDQYSDWIRDFSWLPEDAWEMPITVFYTHYLELLEENYADKETAIDILYEDVFPFWSDEVTRVVVGGQTRSFKVYLISGDGTKEGQGPKLHLVEYRPVIRNKYENDFKRAWFAYGDNTFPPEIEQIIKSMKPGESRVVSIEQKQVEVEPMELELSLSKEDAEQINDAQKVLVQTPAGTALAGVLTLEDGHVLLDFSEGLRAFPLELRIPDAKEVENNG